MPTSRRDRQFSSPGVINVGRRVIIPLARDLALTVGRRATGATKGGAGGCASAVACAATPLRLHARRYQRILNQLVAAVARWWMNGVHLAPLFTLGRAVGRRNCHWRDLPRYSGTLSSPADDAVAQGKVYRQRRRPRQLRLSAPPPQAVAASSSTTADRACAIRACGPTSRHPASSTLIDWRHRCQGPALWCETAMSTRKAPDD